MAGHPVTVELPSAVYDEIRRAAKRSHRTVDALLLEAVTAVASVIDTAPEPLRSSLVQLAFLNDAALWQASRATLSHGHRQRLQALHLLKQQRPLTEDEIAEDESLLRLYRETLLVRAQAAQILKQRGYDVSDPDQFAPLSSSRFDQFS